MESKLLFPKSHKYVSFSVELFWKAIGISSQDDVELAVKFAIGITSVLNLKTMLLQRLGLEPERKVMFSYSGKVYRDDTVIISTIIGENYTATFGANIFKLGGTRKRGINKNKKTRKQNKKSTKKRKLLQN